MADPVRIGHLAAGGLGPLQVHRSAASPARAAAAATVASGATSFRQLLDRADLKFSQHAEQRLRQRGIQLAPDQLDRIASALDQAAAKGAKDSLVLYRDIAMIVNVPNRTVITAMDGASMQQHVFTQIDSAVVVKES